MPNGTQSEFARRLSFWFFLGIAIISFPGPALISFLLVFSTDVFVIDAPRILVWFVEVFSAIKSSFAWVVELWAAIPVLIGAVHVRLFKDGLVEKVASVVAILTVLISVYPIIVWSGISPDQLRAARISLGVSSPDGLKIIFEMTHSNLKLAVSLLAIFAGLKLRIRSQVE